MYSMLTNNPSSCRNETSYSDAIDRTESSESHANPANIDRDDTMGFSDQNPAFGQLPQCMPNNPFPSDVASAQSSCSLPMMNPYQQYLPPSGTSNLTHPANPDWIGSDNHFSSQDHRSPKLSRDAKFSCKTGSSPPFNFQFQFPSYTDSKHPFIAATNSFSTNGPLPESQQEQNFIIKPSDENSSDNNGPDTPTQHRNRKLSMVSHHICVQLNATCTTRHY